MLGKALFRVARLLGFRLEVTRPQINLRSERYAKRLFLRNSLLESEHYFSLANMPSDEDLAKYYRQHYWGWRGGAGNPVNHRDLTHLSLLSKTGLLTSPGKLLNFGSGHGGLSVLLWHLGWDVVNVDPETSGTKFAARWRHEETLESPTLANEHFSLIYGSHSLEHVVDIEATLSRLKKLSNRNTYFFFEVPNGLVSGNGGADGRIVPPHTYYFKPTFFPKHFNVKLLLHAPTGIGLQDHVSADPGVDTQGVPIDPNVIRFLGQRLAMEDS